MDSILSLCKKAADKIKNTNSTIQVVSHYDADGITSAAIITKALSDIEKPFQLKIVNKIIPDLAEIINEREPELVIFTDIGSGYLDIVKQIKSDIIIADHHQIKEPWDSEKLIHINPEIFGLDYISGSVATYLIVEHLTNRNGLVELALVGTMGDLGYVPATSRKMFRYETIDRRKGLKIFGRFSRPLHTALGLSFSHIPSMKGESRALQFLSELKVEPQIDGRWKTLNDLTEEESKKLNGALVKEHLRYSTDFGIEDIFSDVWTLKNFIGELQDSKEFATILNACGRMDESATGVALCLGNEYALERARVIMKNYKRMIGSYLNWIRLNPEFVKKTENATYIVAGDKIHENFIGTIVSMLFRINQEKLIIGLAKGEDGVKISGRSIGEVDINKLVKEAATACGGVGGGHIEAAGATIPFNSEEKFIETCEEYLKNMKTMINNEKVP
jgi:RecJ-like exonuclease